MNKPELVVPAGNLEKLKVAVCYGADAVYLSGERYGLRASADNFTEAEIEEGLAFAHAHGCRSYVTLNAMMHDQDLEGLESYCRFLEAVGADGVIVSDAGVAGMVRLACKIPIHLSTQASCLNSDAARAWKAQGIQRIVLGRELSIAEAGEIQRKAGIDVEMFVHGSMCMAISGRCTISNYTSNRDANRGGCTQACRFAYSQGLRCGRYKTEIDVAKPSHFMSSKDLLGLMQIPRFFQQGLKALKIEGRMKSAFYAALLTSAYRKAVDNFAAGKWNGALIEELMSLIKCVPHRDFTEASFLNPARTESIYASNAATLDNATHDIVGIVLESDASQVLMKNYQSIKKGDEIEFLSFDGNRIRYKIDVLKNAIGKEVDRVRQESIAMLKPNSYIKAFQVVIAPAKKSPSRSWLNEESANVG